MPADIFAGRRTAGLLFGGVGALLTVGAVVITEYDVAKSCAGIMKAVVWVVTNFYPDAASLQKLPDLLSKLAAAFAGLLALLGSRTTRPVSVAGIVVRGIASFFRNIPLVAWAMVLMLAFSQSKLTGYLALFCGSLGFLTRAFMETIDEVGNNPVEALRATGAAYFPIIFQAVLPSCMPQMISWLLFMIDTNIRDAILVGLLTGAGIGFAFDFYYKSFDYHAASLVTILSALMVIAVEIVSNRIRRVIM
jgi:phosphonate transport system permease protein